MAGPDRLPRLKLPSEERMRGSWEFRQTRERGRTLAGRAMVINCLLPDMAPDLDLRGRRFGVVVGRRLGKAVHRNRAKRLLREAYRLTRPRLAKDCRIVMVGRRSILAMDRARVEADFLDLARRAGLLPDPSSSGPSCS